MQNPEDGKKLASLIKGVRTAMLTTLDHDGELRSRPMASQDVEFDGTLWFFTKAESAKVHEIDREHHVNLAYVNPDKQIYVSVSGLARLTRNKQKAKELWSPMHLAWFPEGIDDPDLALLEVQVTKAEYWDSPSSAVVVLAGFAKALFTGKPYDGEFADHGKIQA
jgi:general stress protein 26